MIDIHKPLIILELANNHGGSLEHGLNTIRAFSHSWFREYAKRIQVAFKFQYRTLDTFIHPDYQNRDDIKYVKRFKTTELKEDEFLQLKKAVEDAGFHTMCTPFDEAAADRVANHGYEVIKVGSCSATDWPLLERVASKNIPVIVSTAGVALNDIHRIEQFFHNRKIPLAVMHCVAEYPVSEKDVQLNQIDLLRSHFPHVPIGFSTHEAPVNLESGMMAVAKGATIFERHVGYRTDKYPLNEYSLNPVQTEQWMGLIEQAFAMCGTKGERHSFSEKELTSLHSLRRGIFAKTDLPEGTKITQENTFFAIPTVENQCVANDHSKYTSMVSRAPIKQNQAIMKDHVECHDTREVLLAYATKVQELLKNGHVVLPADVQVEISHHYGVSKLDEFGSAMVTIVNRGYCKKLIVQLPGQKHPEQYHKKKEETFHILYGEALITLDDIHLTCRPGQIVTVPPGMIHTFRTETGSVIEEISDSHDPADSYYLDEEISKNKDRKSWVYWPRYGQEE